MTLDRDVLGTWLLVSFEISYEDGTSELPHGPRPFGILHYAPDGLMLVHLADPGRLAPAPKSAVASGEAARQPFPPYISYAARYRIDGDRVVHKLIVSALQPPAGAELARQATFEDDRLILTVPDAAFDGRSATARLVWERAENPQTGAPR